MFPPIQIATRNSLFDGTSLGQIKQKAPNRHSIRTTEMSKNQYEDDRINEISCVMF
jgi:hypothetical protein